MDSLSESTELLMVGSDLVVILVLDAVEDLDVTLALGGMVNE